MDPNTRQNTSESNNLSTRSPGGQATQSNDAVVSENANRIAKTTVNETADEISTATATEDRTQKATNSSFSNSRDPREVLGAKTRPSSQHGKPALTVGQHLARIFWRFLAFIVIVTLVVSCVGILWVRQAFQPIDLKETNTKKLAQWVVLRDLSKESDAIQEGLVDQYVDLLTSDKIDVDRLEKMPLFDSIKKMAKNAAEKKALENNISSQTSSNSWDFLRKDYRVIPDEHSTSAFVSPNEILPSEQLLLRLKEKNERSGSATDATQKLYTVEKNSQLLISVWFEKKMTEYAQAQDDQKLPTLRKVKQEILTIQRRIQEIAKRLDIPLGGEIAQLKQLNELTTTLFIEYSDTPEKVAQLIWFKDILVSFCMMDQLKVPEATILKTLKKTEPQSESRFDRLAWPRFGKGSSAASDSALPESSEGPDASLTSENASESPSMPATQNVDFF